MKRIIAVATLLLTTASPQAHASDPPYNPDAVVWTPADMSVFPFTPEEYCLSPDLDGPRTFEYSTDMYAKISWDRMAQWSRHEHFISIEAPIADIVNAWRPALDDPHDLLDDAQADQLLGAIIDRLRPLADDDPDAFIEQTARDPTRSIDYRFKELSFQTTVLSQYLRETPEPGTRHIDTLGRLWAAAHELGQLPRELAYAHHGAWFYVHNATPDDPNYWNPVWNSRWNTFDIHCYWDTNSGGGSYPVSVPTLPLETYLETHTDTPAVSVFLLVRLENGTVGRLTEDWYLHDELGWVFENRALETTYAPLCFE